jgi:hypothetical protein
MKMIMSDIDIVPENYEGLTKRDSFVDLQVYKKNTSIRVCNSYKRKAHTYEKIKKSYNCSKEQFLNTCINYTSNCIILEQNVGMTATSHYNTKNAIGYTPMGDNALLNESITADILKD